MQTASFLSILAAALRSRSLRLWNVIHEERNIATMLVLVLVLATTVLGQLLA